MDRKLQSHLVLLVEQELGAEKKFILPMGKHKDGESLKQVFLFNPKFKLNTFFHKILYLDC